MLILEAEVEVIMAAAVVVGPRVLVSVAVVEAVILTHY